MDEVPKANFFRIGLLLIGRRVRYRVDGDSMIPLLQPGEQVLVNEHAVVGVGDIVIARHPFKKSVEMIKRIGEINADGDFFLISDNPLESTDSRSLGFIKKGDILGKVEGRLG